MELVLLLKRKLVSSNLNDLLIMCDSKQSIDIFCTNKNTLLDYVLICFYLLSSDLSSNCLFFRLKVERIFKSFVQRIEISASENNI